MYDMLMHDIKAEGMQSQILNKVCLKVSKWDRGFEAKNTQLLPFVVAPGTSEDVPMMCITGRYPYIKDNDLRYSAIELPYQGGHLGVVIILPDEYFGLGDLLRNMNLETVAELLKNLYMADSPVNLIVPKFKIKNTFQLAPVVSQLGMDDAFQSDKATFSGMVSPSEGLSLSTIIHAAAVLVDEEGTMPTASKNSKARPKTGCSNILKVRVDHPFLYAIVDKRISNTFLYIGHVSNPIL
ncbi:Leukocyte elastase inhibitor C [Bulinus truncatus]|nr:Leukocyte elastase inhibitor C [Bulinus truncatus]